MKFEKKLKSLPAADIWREYCGFLDLSVDEFMEIQNRLLMEQIELLADCGLGKRFFGDRKPKSPEEFRERVPLTKYEDYADILLMKREDMLPRPPVVWLQTTWESGAHPVKLAPYTEEMLKTYRDNLFAGLVLATSDAKGKFKVRTGNRVLYGLAPLPYATGLYPTLIDNEINMRFMPSLKEARKLSLSEQSRVGFTQGFQKGIDLFFGMSSVIYCISKSFRLGGSGGIKFKDILGTSPKMLLRYLTARYKSARDGVPVKPRDLFRLSGFVCVGTDTALYKNELEEYWGRRPLEVAGGTEPTCIGVETWSKNGLVFFPDACFYEFIPENEMLKSLADPSYQPRTYLMNELVANQNYEIVITVLKGGAFLRYRVGDVYRCVRMKNREDGVALPQFEYVDRIPTVIDIAGFTRITESSISKVIAMSRLDITDWFALKEYDDANRSFLHMYVEMAPGEGQDAVVGKKVLEQHLSLYFRHFDHDIEDLKRLLGMEPLVVTILPSGSLGRYYSEFTEPIAKINPPKEAVIELLRLVGKAGGSS